VQGEGRKKEKEKSVVKPRPCLPLVEESQCKKERKKREKEESSVRFPDTPQREGRGKKKEKKKTQPTVV